MKKRDSPKFLGNPSRVRPGQLPRWSRIHLAIAMVRFCRRHGSQQRLPPCAHFGAVYRGPRCSLSTLHPGEGHSPICKTRFRLLARLCRSRVSHPRRVPSRGFGRVLGQVIAFLLSQTSLAHEPCAPRFTPFAERRPSGPTGPPPRAQLRVSHPLGIVMASQFFVRDAQRTASARSRRQRTEMR
jgi:hypothetical protein